MTGKRALFHAAFLLLAPFVFAGCGGCGGSSSLGGSTGSTGGQFAELTNLGQNTQNAINDSGLMTGTDVLQISTTNGFDTQKFADTWQAGAAQPTALPGPGEAGAQNGLSTVGDCISDSGEEGGTEIEKATLQILPVAWQNGSMLPLNIPANQSDEFGVVSVNTVGQIVGYNAHSIGFEPSGISGFYWPNASAQGIALPANFIPNGLNDSGLCVGAEWASSTGPLEFFKIDLNSTTTVLTDLHLSIPQAAASVVAPITVNDSGIIAAANGASDELVEISSSGKQTNLGAGALPEAMNGQGDIVGVNTAGHAFIYAPSKGLLDMNVYVNPTSGLTLINAYSINSGGQVLATAQTKGGQQECVLLQLPKGTF